MKTALFIGAGLVGSASAQQTAELPPMMCELMKNPTVEKKVVDEICSHESAIPASECETGLSKLYEMLAAKECPNQKLTVSLLPPKICELAKNPNVKEAVVGKVCALPAVANHVPEKRCQSGLSMLWDFIASKACPSDAHPERVEQILKIQSMPNVLWRAALHPRFADKAPGASKTLNGVKGNWSEQIEAAVRRGDVHRFDAEKMLGATEDPPESFDSAENWPQCAKMINDIRDQSNCGCCWAFGAAEAASDRMCIATNATIMVPLSAQDICFCSNDDGCGGGQIDSPWNYIKDTGAVSGGQYQGSGPFGKGMCLDFSMPHCHHHGPQGSDPYPAENTAGCPSQKSPQCASSCDKDAAAPHNSFDSDKYAFTGQTVTAGGIFSGGAKGVQKLIMAGGPVETAFTVYEDFENYAGGVYHHVTGGMAGGHAVKIVGWGKDNGEQYWKVANSWNPYWGEKGYFRIKFGEGGIDSHVIGSAPDAKWGKKSDLAAKTLVV